MFNTPINLEAANVVLTDIRNIKGLAQELKYKLQNGVPQAKAPNSNVVTRPAIPVDLYRELLGADLVKMLGDVFVVLESNGNATVTAPPAETPSAEVK